MSHHKALPSRFRRSRSPHHETSSQFGRPARYEKVVIALSDSGDDGMSMTEDATPEPPEGSTYAAIGTAHIPPHGTSGTGGAMNMDMRLTSKEIGPIIGSQSKFQPKQKKNPHYTCNFCHSNQHIRSNCPHTALSLSKQQRKELQKKNRINTTRANAAQRAANRAKNSQIPKGTKVDMQGLEGTRYSLRSGVVGDGVPQPKLAKDAPHSFAGQVPPGQQSAATGHPIPQPMSTSNPTTARAAPAHPYSSYLAQLHHGSQSEAADHDVPQLKFLTDTPQPYRAEVYHGLQSDAVSHTGSQPIPPTAHPILYIAPATSYHGPSYPSQQPLNSEAVPIKPVEHKLDQFTRLKTERDKIAQLQELVPSVSFANARNALLMHRWDLSLAFEMAGGLEDEKMRKAKARRTKRAVEEWEAEHLDDHGPREVKKPRLSNTSALPKTGHEHHEPQTLGLSDGRHMGRGESLNRDMGDEMRPTPLEAHQYSGALGEKARFMTPVRSGTPLDEGNTNHFPVEDAYGTYEVPSHKAPTHFGENEYLGVMGESSRPAEHSHEGFHTASAEDVESILRRLRK